MRTRVSLAGLGTALAALLLAVPSSAATTPCAAPVVTGSTATVTCAYTGDAQTWTVPGGVTSASFDVQGAQGGNSTGGSGGRAVAMLDVTPGAVVNVFVGGTGTSGPSGGGFNGGGSGGGSGGGGASDIRLGGIDLSNRVLIAGGGGGGASTGVGGGGGGTIGQDGKLGSNSTGGAGGNQDGTTGSGLLGVGGSGGSGGGGGGGGGYWGGASGTMGNAGGGGGSGFGPTSVTFSTGYRAGNGQVVITYTVSAVNDPTSTTASCSPGSVVVGQPTTCTATVTDSATSGQSTPTGTVTFGSDTSGGSFSSPGSCDLTGTGTTGQASCSVDYTPGQVGSGTHTIQANYGGDSAHLASSGTATVTVTGRTTSTRVSCTTVNSTWQCIATVTDIDSAPTSTPTGTVSFSSSGRGSFSPTTCTLTSGSGASASCSVSFTSHPPRKATGQTITATYSGDTAHSGSSATTVLS